jgi:hypothetical protein
MKHSGKLIGGGSLLLLVLGSGVLLTRPRVVSFSQPSPNAYQGFVRAAALLPNDAPDCADQAALAAFVARSGEAYAVVQTGLEKPCCVPVQVSKQWSAQHYKYDVPRLKRPARALIARAKLAELEGRTEPALEGYRTA